MRRKITTGVTGATRPSLRDWFTAYTCSPRCAGLSGHRRLAERPAKLDTSVGVSGPHDFAVRSRLTRPVKPKRPSHPAPNVRDDASAPLGRAGMGDTDHIFPKNGRHIFFARRLDIGKLLPIKRSDLPDGSPARSCKWRFTTNYVPRHVSLTAVTRIIDLSEPVCSN